jgi:cytochrome c553
MKTVLFSIVLTIGLLSHTNAVAGDVKAGKAKSATCAGCHGANGIGIMGNYPNLAGQQADYIAKQLKAFKEGTRADAVMPAMVAALSEQDMADLAAYYASFSRDGTPPPPAVAGDDSATVVVAPMAAQPTPVAAKPAYVADAAVGKGLYQSGDKARGITACIDCHGKDGNSTVLINPNLAKQHPQYIEKQLTAFKENTRDNAVMNQISANLSSNDIANLGAYFADTSVVGKVKSSPVVVVKSFKGDVEAGKAKAATCAACHGADGNAVIAMYPSLAGQSEDYLVKQLTEFKSATRVDPVMAGMAAALSADDIQNVSAYYASQTFTPKVVEANAKGKKLYISGDMKNGITACVACHSIDGSGMAKAGFPAIAGQNATYLKVQLEKFRSGARANDRNNMMRNIAIKLSNKDIDALAQYMSSLK